MATVPAELKRPSALQIQPRISHWAFFQFQRWFVNILCLPLEWLLSPFFTSSSHIFWWLWDFTSNNIEGLWTCKLNFSGIKASSHYKQFYAEPSTWRLGRSSEAFYPQYKSVWRVHCDFLTAEGPRLQYNLTLHNLQSTVDNVIFVVL